MKKMPSERSVALLFLLAIGTACADQQTDSCSAEIPHNDTLEPQMERAWTVGSPEEASFTRYSSHFRPTLIRASNTLEGYQQARAAGVRFAESDFRMNVEGIIVSTHEDDMGGTCGRVSERTLSELNQCALKGGAHVATLRDFLELPLEEWFIDLKDSQDNARALEVVQAAIREIERGGRQDGAVLMLYNAPEDAVKLIAASGIRAAMKGYPEKHDDIMRLVEKAAANHFEMVCIQLIYLSPDIIQKSARLGIWHLAWDQSKSVSRWRKLARVGLGGVITRHHQLAKTVADCFEPAPDWSA